MCHIDNMFVYFIVCQNVVSAHIRFPAERQRKIEVKEGESRKNRKLTNIIRIPAIRRSQYPYSNHLNHLNISAIKTPNQVIWLQSQLTPSTSATLPTMSTIFPTCRCESLFNINVTSPWPEHVSVAVSPWSFETVPRMRMGLGLRLVLEGRKAWRCSGRIRGVVRAAAIVIFVWFDSLLGGWLFFG